MKVMMVAKYLPACHFNDLSQRIVSSNGQSRDTYVDELDANARLAPTLQALKQSCEWRQN